MKRFALIAAAALAAPAVFAQSSAIVLAPADVLHFNGVAVSPPVDGVPHLAVPLASTTLLPSTVAIAPSATLPSNVAIVQPSSTTVLGGPPAVASSTAILGGPAAPLGSTQIVTGGTAILDMPAHAVTRPDFQRWIAFEGSRIVGRM